MKQKLLSALILFSTTLLLLGGCNKKADQIPLLTPEVGLITNHLTGFSPEEISTTDNVITLYFSTLLIEKNESPESVSLENILPFAKRFDVSEAALETSTFFFSSEDGKNSSLKNPLFIDKSSNIFEDFSLSELSQTKNKDGTVSILYEFTSTLNTDYTYTATYMIHYQNDSEEAIILSGERLSGNITARSNSQ